MDTSPDLNNTRCESASIDYVPFKPGQDIPENAVQVNGTYIGQVKDTKFNANGHICLNNSLCEIIPHDDPLLWIIKKLGSNERFDIKNVDFEVRFVELK